jgi:hypothetical protein
VTTRFADAAPRFDSSTTSAVKEAASEITTAIGPHGEDQTKVKARFSQVYYSANWKNVYSLLRQSNDKQGFLDKALDASAGSG